MTPEISSLKECIPKRETQLEEFLKTYPEYDGRGILIAIFDNAVDASLPGLQKTTTGLPKIIDCFNFCDDIKVDTSIVREMDEENNILLGLSGRKFKIPTTWNNPSGKWHLGNKLQSEVCTHGKSLKEDVAIISKIHKNLKLTLDVLEEFVVDYIVWHNGEKYQAYIATRQNDDLEDAEVLTELCDDKNERGIIKVIENGNLLEINTSHGSHGTFVAKVAAAYFPNEQEKNGTAPGSQIVLMSVHSKYSYTTSYTTSFEKAVSKCVEMGVDIIVISYALSGTPNIENIVKNVVEKHKVIIVKAAGNLGPCVSSLTADYCEFYANQIFTVGSILSTEMMENYFNNQFFNNKNMSDTALLFSYSSKGPVESGRKGIDFVAPGDAVTAGPKWHSSNIEYISGTSLACPNAAGVIACLLSALKANSIEYNPTMLKLALSNTAHLPAGGDRLGFGDGIIQINSAFEYLKTFSKQLNLFKISKLSLYNLKKKVLIENLWKIPKLSIFVLNKKVVTKLSNQEGIYLIRKQCEQFFSKKYFVKINNKNNEISWILKATPNNFIEHSDTVTDGMFTVSVNGASLYPGSINYAEIHGFDASNISLGPLFKFPITVIISKFVKKNETIQSEIVLTPEIPYNIFLHSPPHSSKCNLKVTALDEFSEEICFTYAVENNVRHGIHHENFTPTKKCKNLSVPEIFCDKMFEISIFWCSYSEKAALKMLKFNIEITFEQQILVPKIPSKCCNKKKKQS